MTWQQIYLAPALLLAAFGSMGLSIVDLSAHSVMWMGLAIVLLVAALVAADTTKGQQ